MFIAFYERISVKAYIRLCSSEAQALSLKNKSTFLFNGDKEDT